MLSLSWYVYVLFFFHHISYAMHEQEKKCVSYIWKHPFLGQSQASIGSSIYNLCNSFFSCPRHGPVILNFMWSSNSVRPTVKLVLSSAYTAECSSLWKFLMAHDHVRNFEYQNWIYQVQSLYTVPLLFELSLIRMSTKM